MAHLIYSLNMTLNGHCHHADAVVDQEHHEYALELLHASEALILGRHTYDLFSAFWPEAATRRDLPKYMQYLAMELQSIPKRVVTTRPLEYFWQNTEILKGPDIDQTREFLSGISGNVVLFGSPALGTSLADANLINEYQFLLEPFISNQGKQVLDGVKLRQRLMLLEARRLNRDVMLLRYASEP
ncbi:dihydrofolate reductase family protein [Photobacterium sp. 1_MG-2023]|uniref:dihydrofolate reductase family protein n=1 Tax=Photobacterium sp. 1_MG-2023 TaxID=3062646 RepID=UPI0026E27916|nr:dihydrofolate reductase family protein [Photobacterium sp. 1_MG-2023]MDO6706958.1 dihydrofolate reductase family protein [Photobacterium sp. 1_MG-2023]